MRETVQEIRRRPHPHLVERPLNALQPFGGRPHTMNNQRLLNDLADGHVRIEAGERVLEDALRPPSESFELALFELSDVHVVEEHAPRRRLQQAQ